MTKFIGGSAVFGQRVSNVETAVDALIGIPMPWAGATPPTNHLLLNGASFNKAAYPKLAAVYPSGVLPDMRGEFIRGWDNGRGVDTARALLAAQGDSILNHAHNVMGFDRNSSGGSYVLENQQFPILGKGFANPTPDYPNDAANGAFSASTGYIRTAWSQATPAEKVVTGENRPRNVAWNYIVRAA